MSICEACLCWSPIHSCCLATSADKIISNYQMCVDAGVSGCSSQVLVFPVGYVLMGPGVAVLFGQAKVDDVHQVALLPEAPETIGWKT